MDETTEDVSKDDVFQYILDKGAVRAEIAFSGGEDSGGCDYIHLLDANGNTVTTLAEASWGSSYDPVQNKWIRQPLTGDERIRVLLCEPVYERYSTFAFEGHAYGYVIWDAVAKTIQMKGSESTYTYEGFDDDVTEQYN